MKKKESKETKEKEEKKNLKNQEKQKQTGKNNENKKEDKKEKHEKKNISKKTKIIAIITTIIILAIAILSFVLIRIKLNSKPEESIIDTNTMSIGNTQDNNEQNEEGVIAYLSIPSINLENAPIKEGTDMNTLNQYLGHFTDSAYLEGNVAIAGHNRGYEKNYFENLDKVKEGDEITYQTKFQTKKYKVSEIKQIKDRDVYVIENTPENKITLITCVKNKGNLRLCVVGEEVQ